jgi:predicted nucleotidyltransferase
MEHAAVISERLEQMPEVVFALLFGSCEKGRHTPRSDLDVAVYADDSLDPRQRFDLRLRIINALCDLGAPDVVMLNDAPPLLAHRALEGRCLVCRDRARYVRFFVRTIAASEDERYWREVHARARRRRIEEGRFGRP